MTHLFAIVIPPDGRRVPRPRSGGKLPADKLIKPVKSKKRVAFLRYALAGNRTFADVMGEFSVTRQNVVTLCAAIRAEHGIGYEIKGNNIRPLIPQGWTAESIFGGSHGA